MGPPWFAVNKRIQGLPDVLAAREKRSGQIHSGETRRGSTLEPRKINCPFRQSGGWLAETVVNTLVCGLSHVVFSLRGGVKSAVGEQGVRARVKIDRAFPSP